MTLGTILKLAAAGVLVGLVLAATVTGINIIEPGSVGVVSVLGTYEKNTLKPGIHFTVPFITRVIKVDTKIQSDVEEFTSYTQDGQKIVVSGTVNYNNNPNLAVETASTIGTDNETITRVVLTPIMLARVKDVIAEYSLVEIIANQATIGKEISEVIRTSLKSQGSISLSDFQVTGFTLDPEVQQAIENKIIASQKQEQAKIELTTAETTAKTNKVLSDSLSPILVEQQRIEVQRQAVSKWSGQSAYFSVSPSNNTPVIIDGK